MANNVFQRIAGGFKRVLPGAKTGAQVGNIVGMPIAGAAIGAASSLLRRRQPATPATGGNIDHSTFTGHNGNALPGGTNGGGSTGGGSSRTIDFGTGGGSSTPVAPQAPQNSGTDQFDAFNLLLTDALRRSQGVNTDELLKRRRALQRASIGRSDEITPEELRTLSPGQQSSIRDGNLKALEPDIDENAYQIKRAETIASNFEKAYTEARKFGDEFAEKIEAPDNVISAYKNLIEADPSNLATILSGVNEKTRMKVISSLDPASFKAAAAAKKSSSGGFNFTDTQIANGAVSAGMTIAEFKGLSVDEQNNYINGQTSDLPAPAATIANKILNKFDTLFRSRAKAKMKALEVLNSGGGKMTINGKTYTVTPSELSEMIQIVNSY